MHERSSITNLYHTRVKLQRLSGILNGISVCFGLDVRLQWVETKSEMKIVSHTTRERKWPGLASDFCCTHLSTIGEEGGFFVIQFDGFCVKVDSGNIVARGEGLVALVLEINSFLGHDGSLAEGGGRGRRTTRIDQSINQSIEA